MFLVLMEPLLSGAMRPDFSVLRLTFLSISQVDLREGAELKVGLVQ